MAVNNMSCAPKVKPDPDQPGAFLPNGAAAKAAEAASVFALADTRKVKPTQRCHRCGTLVKKALKDRVHRCACGCACERDENAAKTLLRCMLEGDLWPGTGRTGSAFMAGWPSETPPIAG